MRAHCGRLMLVWFGCICIAVGVFIGMLAPSAMRRARAIVTMSGDPRTATSDERELLNQLVLQEYGSIAAWYATTDPTHEYLDRVGSLLENSGSRSAFFRKRLVEELVKSKRPFDALVLLRAAKTETEQWLVELELEHAKRLAAIDH